MLAALICLDKPGAFDIRAANRALHLDYLKSTGAVSMAGAFLDDQGRMYGSLIVLQVETLDQARDWAAGDPYAKAGLFASVDIRQWNKVIG